MLWFSAISTALSNNALSLALSPPSTFIPLIAISKEEFVRTSISPIIVVQHANI